MADRYDETRVFDEGCFYSALDYLVGGFPTVKFRKVLEPGVGTGRIAIPVAERGYRVTGVDVSEKMLAVLESHLKHINPPLPISAYKADVLELPFPDASFDMAIVVHLFYFIKDWQKAVREILRVVRKDGPIILMHTGAGIEIPALNQRYKELCTEQDWPIQEIGVSSNRVVVDYLESLGCRIEWVKDRWQWTMRLGLDKALAFLESRSYSFTRLVPVNVHASVIGLLKLELKQEYGSLETEVEVQNQIYLVIIQM
jgi:ubiquinone/menaquinone biosynthesis C-methylase UbiE